MLEVDEFIVEEENESVELVDDHGRMVSVIPARPRLRDLWSILRGHYTPKIIVRRDEIPVDALFFWQEPQAGALSASGGNSALPENEKKLIEHVINHEPETNETHIYPRAGSAKRKLAALGVHGVGSYEWNAQQGRFHPITEESK